MVAMLKIIKKALIISVKFLVQKDKENENIGL